jgi:hypothetical protein
VYRFFIFYHVLLVCDDTLDTEYMGSYVRTYMFVYIYEEVGKYTSACVVQIGLF